MTDRRWIHPLTGEVVEDPHIRPFADWLREQAQGTTHDELSEALWDLVARVKETGKKGSLEFTVTVEPLKGNEELLLVTDQIKLRLPEFPRKPSMFYAGENGNLSRNNPLQPEITGLREVPSSEPDAPVDLDARNA